MVPPCSRIGHVVILGRCVKNGAVGRQCRAEVVKHTPTLVVDGSTSRVACMRRHARTKTNDIVAVEATARRRTSCLAGLMSKPGTGSGSMRSGLAKVETSTIPLIQAPCCWAFFGNRLQPGSHHSPRIWLHSPRIRHLRNLVLVVRKLAEDAGEHSIGVRSVGEERLVLELDAHVVVLILGLRPASRVSQIENPAARSSRRDRNCGAN